MKVTYLHKYLSGECTAHEKQVVEDWLNASERNREFLNALKLIWDVSPGKKIEVDAHKAWESIRPGKLKKPESISGGQLPVDHVQQRKTYPLSSTGRRARALVYAFAAAAVVLITVMFTQYVSPDFITPQTQPTMQEVVTERGQRTKLRLLDGTRVHLNVDSRLNIPGSFNSASRQVYLEGEAFFEVVSNPDKPFLVHTGEGVTEVLGTKFDVRSYPDENQIQVVVAEGKVLLSSEGQETDQKVQLTRNRQGILSKDGDVMVSDIQNLDEHIGWKAGKLTFHGASLYEVKHRLERWYDIDITLKNEFSSLSRRLTASFETEPLTEVLNVIALALEVKYKLEDRKVIIYRDK